MVGTTHEQGGADWRPLPTTGTSQIVVAAEHERLVGRELEYLFGITAAEPRHSQRLGLVLLNLPGVDEPGGPSLEVVLKRLYDRFKTHYNWVPTFGQNRQVASVVPQNKTDPGVAPLNKTDPGVAPQNKTDPGDDGAPRAVDVNSAGWPARATAPGDGVRVGVGDTAVARRPQLWGSVVADSDSLLPAHSEELPAQLGHGSFVTGLVVREAPGATVRVRRLLETPGETDSWDVATKLVQFADDGLDVLNLSLGCHTDDGNPPLVFARALERIGPHVLVVAAAGNFAPGHVRKAVWPAAFESVVAVGATDAEGNRPDWSLDPERAPWVDVEAVGVDVLSVYLDGKVATELDERGRPTKCRDFDGFGRWSGTSFAAARVTGMIAAATRPGHRSARDALEQLTSKASAGDARPWLG